MESNLFTALSTNEEANLSGGYYYAPKINVNVVKTNQVAVAVAKGFYPTAYASNSSNVYIDN